MIAGSTDAKKPTRVILFDIDGTLIKDGGMPYSWSGNGVTQWQAFCEDIIKCDREHGTYTLFGIATFKPEFKFPGGRGDAVSDMVLAECGQPAAMSLKKYLDQKLIFFTQFMCKVEYALKKVSDKHDHLKPDDIWIIDDAHDEVIKPSQKAGYRAYHAKNFNTSTEAVASLHSKILEDVLMHNRQYLSSNMSLQLQSLGELLIKVQLQQGPVKSKADQAVSPKPLLLHLRGMLEQPYTNALTFESQDPKKNSPRKK